MSETKTPPTSEQSDHSEQGPYQIRDAEELSRNLARFMEEGSKVFTSYLEKMDNQKGALSAAHEAEIAGKTIGNVAQQWLQMPEKLAEKQNELFHNYAELWSHSVQQFWHKEPFDPVAKPAPGDNRFQDPEWSENPFFDFLKQSYLLTAQWAEDIVEETDTLDAKTKKKAEFYLGQIASALSPSNFLFTNPQILRETLETNGANLAEGMQQLAQDLKNSSDLLKISQTDTKAFEVGRNLAITPGKVVFQNDVMQLIQYKPSTPEVHEMPLLIVPPWINKFYILDLVPQKSFIKWVVDKGYTVFVVSWVNPDADLAKKSFENYMHEGILTAIDVVTNISKTKQTNILGYCVGGTLLGATLAYMAQVKDDRVHSATFLTTQLDFTKAGDLLLFTDDEQLKAIEELMQEKGYLDGSRMANVFNMLRPRDLIWPYVVNNYLLGKKPFPFDLLFWNQDSTRMPAANHSFYLREFYRNNALARGNMELSGEKLDLSEVKVPVYELAAREDHIAPARSAYLGAKMLGGPVKFVLAGSGHIAGVVNPPNKKKYQYWTNTKSPADLDLWLKNAKEHPGSWWNDWIKWLGARSGERIPARKFATRGKFKPIEDAPGSYVKVRA